MPKQNKNWEREILANSYRADHHEENEVVLQVSRAIEITSDILQTQKHQLIEELMGIVEGIEIEHVELSENSKLSPEAQEAYKLSAMSYQKRLRDRIKQKLKSLRENK